MMSTLFKAGSTTSFPMVSHSPFPKIPVIPLPQRNSPSSFPLPLYPQHIHWEISWGFMGNTMKKKGPDLEIVKKKPFSVLFLGKMMNNEVINGIDGRWFIMKWRHRPMWPRIGHCPNVHHRGPPRSSDWVIAPFKIFKVAFHASLWKFQRAVTANHIKIFGIGVLTLFPRLERRQDWRDPLNISLYNIIGQKSDTGIN